MINKCVYYNYYILIYVLCDHHRFEHAALILHQRRPNERPDCLRLRIRHRMLGMLVDAEQAEREVEVQIERRLVVGHFPGEPHARADVAEQRQAVLQARVLVQCDEYLMNVTVSLNRQHSSARFSSAYLVGNLPLHVAGRKSVRRQSQVLVHGPIDAQRCAGGGAQNATHLGQLAVAQRVARTEGQLYGI